MFSAKPYCLIVLLLGTGLKFPDFLAGQSNEEINEHVVKLESPDPEVRSSSVNFVISMWENEGIIALLKKALQNATDNKREDGVRKINSVLSRIELRRSMGRNLVAQLGDNVDDLLDVGMEERVKYLGKRVSDSTFVKSWVKKISDTSGSTKIEANKDDECIGKLAEWISNNLPPDKIYLHQSLIDLLYGKEYVNVERDPYTLFLSFKVSSDLQRDEFAFYYPTTTTSARILSKYLEFGDANVKCKAIILLGYLKANEYAEQIVKIMRKEVENHRFPFISQYCIEALADMGAKEQSKVIAELLSTRWDGYAAMALADLGAEEYVDAIADKVMDIILIPHQNSAKFFIEALVKFKAVKHADKIATVLYIRDSLDKCLVIDSLNKLGAKKYLPKIAEFLNGECAPHAIRAIADLKGEEYYEDIRQLLEDKEEHIRILALKAFGSIQDRKYAKDVAVLLNDKSPLIRITAIITLDLLKAEEYLKEIKALLTDEEIYDASGCFVGLRKVSVGEVAQRVVNKWKDESK